MKKLSALLVVLVITTTLFAAGSREEGTSGGVKKIVVASDATWPPMEYVDENKNIVGFDVDLIRAIAENGGFEVEIRNVAWDGIFAGLANGQYDAVISSVTITDERKQSMDFSEPYINAGQVLVVRKDSSAVKLADLSGKSVGAQIGTTGAFEIEKARITLKSYDELGFAMEDLVSGRIEGVVADAPTAAAFALQNEKYAAALKIVGEPFTDEYYGIAVRKGNAEVLSLINSGLAKVKAAGIDKQLESKWLR
jgi:polar amino acid transport system substrate-binding protein